MHYCFIIITLAYMTTFIKPLIILHAAGKCLHQFKYQIFTIILGFFFQTYYIILYYIIVLYHYITTKNMLRV